MASRQPLQLAQGFISRLRASGRRRATLPGYTNDKFWQRRPLLWGLGYIVLLASFGAIIGFTGRSFLLPLSIPLILLGVCVIWALPDTGHAPTRWVKVLVFTFIVALLTWPDYLALAIPGLPWITAVRLVAAPLALVLLISLSTSSAFRAELTASLNTTPLTWKFLVAFMAVTFLTVPFSAEVGGSLNKVIVAQLYWTLIFFCSAWVFIVPGRARLFAWFIWGIAVYVCIIGFFEWRQGQVPWAGHTPSFLQIQDPAVQRILEGTSRAATGVYRVQSKFTTPLGLAEFLGLITPFILYFLMFARSLVMRLAALATLLLVTHTIIMTDSRLGIVGLGMSLLLFLLAWAVLRWSLVKGSIFGPATVLAYPAVFVAFLASTFVVGRVRGMVWGSGAETASTEARRQQIEQGIPMILSQPWGRGMGRGGPELGFTNAAGTITIDNYYLSLALDFGIAGFLLFFAIFFSQLYYGARTVPKIRTMEELLIVPIMIALTNFMVLKSVFSQQENHSLIFLMLGVLTALIYRIQQQSATGVERPREFFASSDAGLRA